MNKSDCDLQATSRKARLFLAPSVHQTETNLKKIKQAFKFNAQMLSASLTNTNTCVLNAFENSTNNLKVYNLLENVSKRKNAK